jgi:hypothetical protein
MAVLMGHRNGVARYVQLRFVLKLDAVWLYDGMRFPSPGTGRCHRLRAAMLACLRTNDLYTFVPIYVIVPRCFISLRSYPSTRPAEWGGTFRDSSTPVSLHLNGSYCGTYHGPRGRGHDRARTPEDAPADPEASSTANKCRR